MYFWSCTAGRPLPPRTSRRTRRKIQGELTFVSREMGGKTPEAIEGDHQGGHDNDR